MRHGLLPALQAVHPAAERNVLRTAALLREETELLESLVAAELDGRTGVELSRLREMPAALARMVVVRLAEQAAGTYVPQAGERVGEILDLARRGGRAGAARRRPRRRGDRGRGAADGPAAAAPGRSAARGLDSQEWPHPRA